MVPLEPREGLQHGGRDEPCQMPLKVEKLQRASEHWILRLPGAISSRRSIPEVIIVMIRFSKITDSFLVSCLLEPYETGFPHVSPEAAELIPLNS